MKLTYVASPGITGFRQEVNVDTSKRIDGMYYNSEKGLTPIAYCYKIEDKVNVAELFDRQIAEERQMKDRHYKELLALRGVSGV